MSNKYAAVLALHILMIFLDLSFNTAATILYNDNNAQLMIFILQDTAIVLSIIILLITFSSTFVFQAGLISILVKRFSPSIIVSTIYLFLCITLHVTSLRDRWGTTERYIWPISITVIYVIQRITAIIHYFLFKRAVLFISDPRYHYDTQWLRDQVKG
jgi:hypothetical protein